MSRLSLLAWAALVAFASFVAIGAAFLWAIHPYLAWGWLAIAVVQLFLDYTPTPDVADAVGRSPEDPSC
jgi:hypothetical protein